MTVPQVSVVIPTHDRLPLLKEALRSVLRQQVDLEVIVVDDGSQDGTADWVEDLNHPAVRLYRQSPSRGGSAARNIGLDACRGPFVMFLDDDDVLRTGALESLRAALQNHPAAVGAAGAYTRFGAVDASRRDLHPRRTVMTPVWKELLFGWNMPPAALLWRTSVARDLGGWDISLRRGEDRDLNLRAYPRSFVLIPATVMEYRVHPAQVPRDVSLPIHRHVIHRFVASLTGNDKEVGEAILRVTEPFLGGLTAYSRGDYRSARSPLRRALSGGTTLWRSPVLGGWLAGLVAKSTIGALLPNAHARALQQRLRRRGSYDHH